ncbi:MAG TPA: hypothetical protein VFE32_05025 [Puia sp.]|jgi:antitoxin component YwqK of YwqJK toxin-antitoxin module|nr:hypothetical protein [Puia sp.]
MLSILFVALAAIRPVATPADTAYKSWYFTPTGVYGRMPLQKTKYRPFVKVSHPSAGLAMVRSFSPANVLVNTTRVYFKNGLLSLTTETDRWGYTYDSIWYQPEEQGKFLVTERKKGVNPFIPCKYLEYTFKEGLLTDILCFRDSIRAGDNQEGVAHYVFERYTDPDRHGLIRTETFLSNIDAPAFSRTADCHKLVNDYDAKGNLVSRSTYDQDDKPILDRYGVFRTKYKYDGDDNETEADYYDTKDNLTVAGWGYAEKVRDYKHGFLAAETYYYDQNTIVRSNRLADSVAIIRRKYDEAGNETETTYFDPLEYPIANAEGVHKLEYEYSAAGMLSTIRRFRLDAQSTWGESKQYLSVNFERDDKGLVTGTRYATNTGIVIRDPEDGAFLTKTSYDAWGRIHAKSCWRTDSAKMACNFGYQEIVHRYNDDGQVAETDYNDSTGNPYAGPLGYSRMITRYNEQGLPGEWSFFAGDKPVTLRLNLASISGFHRVQYSYDGLNRLRSINFYDAAGNPANAVLRPSDKTQYTAHQVDLDYTAALLTSESFRASGAQNAPISLECSKGDCLPLIAFTSIRLVGTPASMRPAESAATRSFHGGIRPDTLIDDQLGFVGHDTILLFLRNNSGWMTGIGCGDIYRIAPVNKYYQLDGQVNDYYMTNDSIEASFNYVKGNLQDPAYIYYPNGQVKEHGDYQNNDRSGQWDYYYDNGQKEKTLQFENGGAYVVDCYTRNGEALARGGNGRFVGTVVTNTTVNPYEMQVSGNVKNGLPDGEWNLYINTIQMVSKDQKTVPSNVEYFSGGKFLHGTSNSMSGRQTYSDRIFSRIESIHPYEYLDHYRQDLACRTGNSPVMLNNLFPDVKLGIQKILSTSKYGDYSGWILLDVHINSAGRVISSYVRLYQPNEAFGNEVRAMASRLAYPSMSGIRGSGMGYEKFYIILVEANDVVIPEQILQDQRSIVPRR